MNDTPIPSPGAGFWSTAVAAARVGLTRHYLETEAKAGRLPHLRVGSATYWNPDSLLVALKERCGYDPHRFPRSPVKLVPTKEMAKRIGVSCVELCRMARSGELPSFACGNAFYFEFDSAYATLARKAGAQ